jgi:hypothetical protein
MQPLTIQGCIVAVVQLAIEATTEVGGLIHVQPKAIKRHLLIKARELSLQPGVGLGMLKIIWKH